MAQFIYVQWLVKFFESREFDFEWDEGNKFKSIIKHDVSNENSEEVFFDEDILILGQQVSPVSLEERFGIIGKTMDEKILFVNFTFRNLKIRIISSRLASNKERGIYEKSKR
ncbi:MAG: BrnT family toxin [Bacteriovoracaceae bacterium]|jgi:uncharacterized DUF497 family protein